MDSSFQIVSFLMDFLCALCIIYCACVYFHRNASMTRCKSFIRRSGDVKHLSLFLWSMEQNNKLVIHIKSEMYKKKLKTCQIWLIFNQICYYEMNNMHKLFQLYWFHQYAAMLLVWKKKIKKLIRKSVGTMIFFCTFQLTLLWYIIRRQILLLPKKD